MCEQLKTEELLLAEVEPLTIRLSAGHAVAYWPLVSGLSQGAYLLSLYFIYALNEDGCDTILLMGIHSTKILFMRRSGRARRLKLNGTSLMRRSGISLLSPTIDILVAAINIFFHLRLNNNSSRNY